ncbi:MAG TPA: hypothetical protein VN345_11650 [Blastocatellia bacterium]|nr:hypothetical protein [Blastocatellia bacterium]
MCYRHYCHSVLATPHLLWYIRGMALKFPLSFGVSLAIALAGLAPSSAAEDQGRQVSFQGSRITALISELADQARASDDVLFALKAQAQAAMLLMPYDREGSRAIFRRVFDKLSDLLSDSGSQISDKGPQSNRSPSRADLEQLRADLMTSIAARDPELVEELGRAIAFAKSAGGVTTDSHSQDSAAPPDRRASGPEAGGRYTVRRELLIGVALQIVEREPQRAMSLAQLSLADGVSPNMARLLLLVRTADAGLADSLFSNAVAQVEKSVPIWQAEKSSGVQIDRFAGSALADIHTLAAYLVSAGNVTSDEAINLPTICRFLNFALAQIMLCGSNPAGAAGDLSSDENSAAYFIGRQLEVLFARYLPSRLPELGKAISALSQQAATDVAADPARLQVQQPEGPADTESEASVRQDEEERDSLFARAALAWLSRGDIVQAQDAAFRISNSGLHDRVLSQIVRKQTSEGRIEDAVATSQRIEQDTARVSLLVKLASAALASGDKAKAAELLDEAEAEANKGLPSLARAQALLTVVASFSAFDPQRSFDVMQTAVKAINDLPGQTALRAASAPAQAQPDGTANQDAGFGEISYRLNFDSTLGELARADYDRALLLARGLIRKEVSIRAQLAACRGGLAPAAAAPAEQVLSAEMDASQQHSPQ